MGNYIFRYSTLSVQSPGATLVDGETTEPVSGRILQRLRGAYGSTSEIEPADEETILLVAAHLEAMGREQRAAEVLATADPKAIAAAEREAGLAAERAAEAATAAEQAQADADEAARVQAEADAAAADEAAKRESFERAAVADSNAVAAQAGLAKAEDEAKAKEAADAAAAEEERLKAQVMAEDDAVRRAAAEAAAEADLPPIDAPAETPGTTPVESEANVAEAIASVEPVIDDDIDTIDEPDILRAIASGLGLDPEGKDMPALKVAIRKARETG